MSVASFLHGKNTRVLMANPAAGAAYDISQFFNSADVTIGIDTPETTSFQNGGVKTYIVGLRDGSINLSGMFDGSTGAVDEILNTAIANDGDDSVVVMPDGGTSANSIAYMARGIEAKYDLKSPVNGVVAIDTAFAADGGVWRGYGQSMTVTGNGNTTPLSNPLGTTTKGGLLVIGVTALTGTLSVNFQHSSGSSYSSISGSNITSTGCVVLTSWPSSGILANTRLQWTLSGAGASATLWYGFARY